MNFQISPYRGRGDTPSHRSVASSPRFAPPPLKNPGYASVNSSTFLCHICKQFQAWPDFVCYGIIIISFIQTYYVQLLMCVGMDFQGLKMRVSPLPHTWLTLSSVESQKGAMTIQRRSVEIQKGAIAIDS